MYFYKTTEFYFIFYLLKIAFIFVFIENVRQLQLLMKDIIAGVFLDNSDKLLLFLSYLLSTMVITGVLCVISLISRVIIFAFVLFPC